MNENVIFMRRAQRSTHCFGFSERTSADLVQTALQQARRARAARTMLNAHIVIRLIEKTTEKQQRTIESIYVQLYTHLFIYL